MVGTLLLVGITLGFFVFSYFIMKVYAVLNPWVRDVKRMGWCCNPAFSMWYFEYHRHKWVAYILTICTVLIGIPIWWFYMFLNGIYFISSYGELVYLITAAISLTLGILLLIAIGYALIRHHAPK